MTFRILFCFISLFSIKANSALKDPTRPIGYDVSDIENIDFSDKTKELEIQGLFVSASKRVALINNTFFTVGEITPRGALVAIFKDRIVLKQGEAMHVVFMINQKVRKDK